MSRYYCPFCSSRYQFHKNTIDGSFICYQCGEPLIKRYLINPKRIVGVFVASAFLAPLVIMIFFAIEDYNREKLPNNVESFISLIIEK